MTENLYWTRALCATTMGGDERPRRAGGSRSYDTPHPYDPASGTVCSHALHVCDHWRGFPTETVSAVSGTPYQATARHQRRTCGAHLAVAVVRLAPGSCGGTAGDVS